MKIIFVLFLCICNSLSGLTVETTSGRAYVPEPVLMIHGFNADAHSWDNLIHNEIIYGKYEPYGIWADTTIDSNFKKSLF